MMDMHYLNLMSCFPLAFRYIDMSAFAKQVSQCNCFSAGLAKSIVCNSCFKYKTHTAYACGFMPNCCCNVLCYMVPITWQACLSMPMLQRYCHYQSLKRSAAMSSELQGLE